MQQLSTAPQTHCFHPFLGSFDVSCFQLSPFLRPLLYHKLKSVVLSFNAFFFPYHWPKTRRVTCDKLGDRAIKHLLYSVIAKYNDLSRRSIVCLSFRYQQIIDLLATDKSRYFGSITGGFPGEGRESNRKDWYGKESCVSKLGFRLKNFKFK